MSFERRSRRFLYDFRKEVWVVENSRFEDNIPTGGCGSSVFGVTNPSEVKGTVDGFPKEIWLFPMSMMEGELPIAAYKSFLVERDLAEAEGDALLTEALRVCSPLEVYALSAIITRTQALCAVAREIAQKRRGGRRKGRILVGQGYSALVPN